MKVQLNPTPTVKHIITGETEFRLKKWYANVGDHVRKSDEICTLESGKSIFDVKSPCNGILGIKHLEQDDLVEDGQDLFTIDESW